MRLSLVVLLTLAVVACKKSQPPAPAETQQAGPAAMAPQAPGSALRGKVLERIDAAPYSYLRLGTSSGEVWAAVPQTTVKAGEEVTIAGPMPMDGFESKTLKRKFDKIYFGTLGGGQAAAPAPAQPAAPAGMMAGPAAPAGAGAPPNPAEIAARHAGIATSAADVGNVKVTKAEGPDARTVAEVFAQKASLKEKKVAVRGKVVKFSAGIMGLNWVHLRDGTGSADKANNDLTVTTNDAAAVGDVVVAKGVVRTDKDFGAGYTYPVIVQEGKLAK